MFFYKIKVARIYICIFMSNFGKRKSKESSVGSAVRMVLEFINTLQIIRFDLLRDYARLFYMEL